MTKDAQRESETARPKTARTKPKPTPLPDPSEEDLAAAADAARWFGKRSPPVAVDVNFSGVAMGLGPKHNNEMAFTARLGRAFGTRSDAFQSDVLIRLLNSLFRATPCELEVNAIVAFFDAMAPENEAEALLVAQMYAAHVGSMTVMGRHQRAETLDQAQAHVNGANKFMRTFGMHLETLQKLRRGGEQTVRVEHVHVHAGGQAVVGNVTQGGGGDGKFAAQSHAQSEFSPFPQLEMRGEDPFGLALHGASGARETTLQDARGDEPGRTEGQPQRLEARIAQRGDGEHSRATPRTERDELTGTAVHR